MGADAANQFTNLYFVPGAYHFGGPHAAKIGGDKANEVYTVGNHGVQKGEPPAKGSGANQESRDKVVVKGAGSHCCRHSFLDPDSGCGRCFFRLVRRAGAFESIVTVRVALTALGVDPFGQSRIGNRPSLLSIWTGTGIPAFTTEPHMSTYDPELRTKMNRQVYFSGGAKEVLL